MKYFLQYMKFYVLVAGFNSADPTDMNNFQLNFTKNTRQALIRFHSVAGKTEPLYRITIIYN